MEDVPFYCLKCEKHVDEVFVDGYIFGDRILEGVDFKVRNINGQPIVISDFANDPYFVGLDTLYWIKECEEFCKGLDFAECMVCRGEILVWSGL